MTLRIYGPDEPWPTKKLPSHFRKPLEQAQAAGWSLHHHGAAHLFGTLVCPAGECDPHVHTFKIDGTASGSTFWAMEASKTVTKKCQHGVGTSGSKVKDRQAECERLLAGAEKLLVRVSDGLDRVERSREAIAVLDQLDMQLEAADATVQEALAADQEQAQEEALQAAYDAEGAPEIEDLDRELSAAEDAVAESNDVAAKLRRSRETLARPLFERGSACLDRISELRIRLDGLKSGGEAADR